MYSHTVTLACMASLSNLQGDELTWEYLASPSRARLLTSFGFGGPSDAPAASLAAKDLPARDASWLKRHGCDHVARVWSLFPSFASSLSAIRVIVYAHTCMAMCPYRLALTHFTLLSHVLVRMGLPAIRVIVYTHTCMAMCPYRMALTHFTLLSHVLMRMGLPRHRPRCEHVRDGRRTRGSCGSEVRPHS